MALDITTIPDFKMWYEPMSMLDDVEIHFNQGIRICMKDASNALLVQTLLRSDIRNTYSVAISLEQLKTAKGEVSVLFDSNKLVFKNGVTNYKVSSLADPKVKTATFPDIKWDFHQIEIPKDKVKELMNVAEKEETMYFIADGGNLSVRDEEDTIEVVYEGVVKPSLKLKSGFGFDYIGPIIKSLKHFDNLEVFIGNSVPAKIHMWNDIMDVTYLIAPRIED